MYRQSETRAGNHQRHARARNASSPTQANNTARGARTQPPNQGTIHAASEDTHTSPCATIAPGADKPARHPPPQALLYRQPQRCGMLLGLRRRKCVGHICDHIGQYWSHVHTHRCGAGTHQFNLKLQDTLCTKPIDTTRTTAVLLAPFPLGSSSPSSRLSRRLGLCLRRSSSELLEAGGILLAHSGRLLLQRVAQALRGEVA